MNPKILYNERQIVVEEVQSKDATTWQARDRKKRGKRHWYCSANHSFIFSLKRS